MKDSCREPISIAAVFDTLLQLGSAFLVSELYWAHKREELVP